MFKASIVKSSSWFIGPRSTVASARAFKGEGTLVGTVSLGPLGKGLLALLNGVSCSTGMLDSGC